MSSVYGSRKARATNAFVKPLFVGAACSAAAYYFIGKGNVVLPMLNSKVPVWAFYGGAGAASSYVAEIAHSYILPHISPNNKFANMEAMVLGPAAAAGAIVLASGVANPALISQVGLPTTAMLGAGAEIAGHYVYETFFST